jgi:photosystem II stability/assembly factor-like uncharacterized protein
MKNSITMLFIFLSLSLADCLAQKAGWELIQSNTTENLNSIFFYDHQFGIACGNSGVMLKSIDSGKTWQALQSPLTTNINDCFMSSVDCFTAVGDSAWWVSTNDAGNTWITDNIYYLVGDIYSLSFFPRAQNFYDGIYGADSLAIMTGSSTYCADVINDFSKNGSGGFYATNMLSPEIGFVVGENSISQLIVGRANNYPQGWDFIYFYLDGKEGRGTGIAFTDSLIGFISAIVWDGGGAIAKTTDNGDNWTTKFFNQPLHDINFPINGISQVGYCVGDSGIILKTFNGGENWYHQFPGINENLNQVYFVDQNFGFIVGDNGLILRTTTGGGPVSSIVDDDNLPADFILYQNYPNPFNPTTNIKFRIAESGFVSLKVYDVLGNEVAVLVDEYKPAGSYEVDFNTSTLKLQASSGIYFYQIVAGNFVQTKKMILLK